MTEMLSDREIFAAYNVSLAETLLSIANAEDKITAASFSAQLFNWAGTNLRILRDELNFDLKPTTPAIRNELKNVISAADKLNKRLILLTSDAAQSIRKAFLSNPEYNELEIMGDGDNVLDNLMLSLDALSRASDIARKIPRTINKGEKQRLTTVRKGCVGELATAWVMLTGERPTRLNYGTDHEHFGKPYGPFYEFVITALTPLIGKANAVKGIDDVIRDVIQIMGKNPNSFSSDYFHM